MKKEKLYTEKLPTFPVFSQGIKVGNFVFTSAFLALKAEDGKLIQGTFEEETVKAMENLKACVESAGLTMGDVIKTTVYLTDLKDFPTFNQVYCRYFSDPMPARGCVEVSGLVAGGRVEIEAIAFKAE